MIITRREFLLQKEILDNLYEKATTKQERELVLGRLLKLVTSYEPPPSPSEMRLRFAFPCVNPG